MYFQAGVVMLFLAVCVFQIVGDLYIANSIHFENWKSKPKLHVRKNAL